MERVLEARGITGREAATHRKLHPTKEEREKENKHQVGTKEKQSRAGPGMGRLFSDGWSEKTSLRKGYVSRNLRYVGEKLGKTGGTVF